MKLKLYAGKEIQFDVRPKGDELWGPPNGYPVVILTIEGEQITIIRLRGQWRGYDDEGDIYRVRAEWHYGRDVRQGEEVLIAQSVKNGREYPILPRERTLLEEIAGPAFCVFAMVAVVVIVLAVRLPCWSGIDCFFVPVPPLLPERWVPWWALATVAFLCLVCHLFGKFLDWRRYS